MIRILSFVALVLMFVVGGFAIFPKSIDSEAQVKIGAILPIESQSAEDLGAKRAIELGINKINSTDEEEKKIEVVFEDGGCDSKKSGEAAKKLIDSGVKIIIVGGCDDEIAAVSGVLKTYGGILISYSGLNSQTAGAGESAFSVTSPDFFEGSFLANYFISDLKVNKSALLYDESVFGEASSNNFRKYFTGYDGEMVLDSVVDFSQDIQGVVDEVKSSKPEAVYVAVESKEKGFEILKGLREEGINSYFASPISIFDSETISKNPKTFEGSLAISPEIDWKNNLKAKNFREEYKTAFGEYPVNEAFYAYDSLLMINDAVSLNYHGKNMDTQNISEWMKSLTDWPGVSGLITIDSTGNGITSKSLKKVSKTQIIDVGQYTIDAEKKEGY